MVSCTMTAPRSLPLVVHRKPSGSSSSPCNTSPQNHLANLRPSPLSPMSCAMLSSAGQPCASTSCLASSRSVIMRYPTLTPVLRDGGQSHKPYLALTRPAVSAIFACMKSSIALSPSTRDRGCWETDPVLWQDFVRAKKSKQGRMPNKLLLFTEEFCAQYVDLETKLPEESTT